MTSKRADREGRDDMTAVLPERDFDVLDVVRSVHDDLDLPEGYRAEIIGGQIAVSASPLGAHAFIIDIVREEVNRALPAGYRAYEVVTIEEPEGDRYIPDLAAWPARLLRGARTWVFPAAECLFVLEVSSPGQKPRDDGKADGYARGGVPIYLLVDYIARESAIHSDPDGQRYRTVTTRPFGETIRFSLPGGDEATIDTSAF